MSLLQDNYKGFLADFQRKIAQSSSHRINWEQLAYVCDVYFKRSLDQSPGTNKVAGSNTMKLAPRDQAIHIPKIKKIARGIKNMLLKNQPRWNIQAGWLVKAPSEDEVEVAQKILDYYYKKAYVRTGLRDIVTDGFVKSLWWCSVLWDSDGDECKISFESPDNIYTSPDCRFEWPTITGSYVIRRYVRGIQEVKTNPLYANGKFGADVAKLVASYGKEKSLFNRLTGNLVVYTNTDGMGLVEEIYVMDDKTVPMSQESVLDALKTIAEGEGGIDALEGREETKESKLRVIAMVGDVVIRDEFLDYDYFPWFGYKPEHDHGQIYTRPWLADLIPLADAINRAWTNRDVWINNVARGRIMIKKNTKLSTLKNTFGIDIVQYEGDMPTEMRIENMPSQVGSHIAEASSIMEDVGGIHGVSVWQNIGTNYSGTAITALQAADLDNVSEPKENLETFFEELAYRILDCESKFGKIKRFQKKEGGEMVAMGIAGMEAAKIAGLSTEGAIMIKPFDNIEVDIVPGSAFTDIIAVENLVKMKELGLKIPDSAIMEAMKIGNTRELMNRALQEEEMAQEFKDGHDALEVKQAELETMKLLEGIPVAAQQWENHEIHNAIHGKALQSLDKSDPRAEALRKHMLQHEAMVNPQAQLPGETEIPVWQVWPGAAPPDWSQEVIAPPMPGAEQVPVAA